MGLGRDIYRCRCWPRYFFFGLLPGSFLAGAIGLNLAGKLFGTTLVPSLFPKIVAVSMSFGAVLFGIVITFVFAALGSMGGALPGAAGRF